MRDYVETQIVLAKLEERVKRIEELVLPPAPLEVSAGDAPAPGTPATPPAAPEAKP